MLQEKFILIHNFFFFVVVSFSLHKCQMNIKKRKKMKKLIKFCVYSCQMLLRCWRGGKAKCNTSSRKKYQRWKKRQHKDISVFVPAMCCLVSWSTYVQTVQIIGIFWNESAIKSGYREKLRLRDQEDFSLWKGESFNVPLSSKNG